MSQAVHLVSKNLPGYGPSEGRCLPCLGVSGRAVAVSSCPSHGDFKIRSQVKIGTAKSLSKEASFACRRDPGGYKRNPDFLRQNKNGFRSRNWQNEGRDSFDNEAGLLSSKNGPVLSLSNSPKFQATAALGPKEKEIVELFRKVQTQLRERAAAKEDRKIKAMQGQRKESETVDSLLKLLRKHSVEQGKRKSPSIGGNSKGFNLDDTEPNGSYDEDKSTNFFDSPSGAWAEAKEPNGSSLTRPASNFRRGSPVTQFKYQPIYSTEETVNSVSLNSSGKTRNSLVEICTDPKQVPEPKTEQEREPEVEPEASFADGNVYDEVSDVESNLVDDSESNILEDSVYGVSESEALDVDDGDNNEEGNKQEQIETEDLRGLKLPELRAVAKSRGVKGFSKMKKGELVKLLSVASV